MEKNNHSNPEKKNEPMQFEDLVSLADQFHDLSKQLDIPQKKKSDVTVVENGVKHIRKGVFTLVEENREMQHALAAVAQKIVAQSDVILDGTDDEILKEKIAIIHDTGFYHGTRKIKALIHATRLKLFPSRSSLIEAYKLYYLRPSLPTQEKAYFLVDLLLRKKRKILHHP